MNFTGCSTVVTIYLCPSSVRVSRPAVATASTPTTRSRLATEGATDTPTTRPTCYTDIDPNGIATAGWVTWPRPTVTRHPASTACLKQGKTPHLRDHRRPSNTIAIGEDAGRDPRFLSPYTEAITTEPDAAPDPRPWPARRPLTPARRYWRWAEPDTSYGVSGHPNNKYRPMNEHSPWQLPTRHLRHRGQQRRRQRRTVLLPSRRRQRPDG